MSNDNEDDKPTVVLDLNALKKQKLKQDEELANMGSNLEFIVPESSDENQIAPPSEKTVTKPPVQVSISTPAKGTPAPTKTRVILFDFNSDFFQTSLTKFPKGYDYQVAKTLDELNKFLRQGKNQIVCFNYDVNAKAVGQLTTQIKAKFPHTKTMIMAKSISPEKALAHAQTPAGAHGYYQYPLDAKRVEKEFQKIKQQMKMAS